MHQVDPPDSTHDPLNDRRVVEHLVYGAGALVLAQQVGVAYWISKPIKYLRRSVAKTSI